MDKYEEKAKEILGGGPDDHRTLKSQFAAALLLAALPPVDGEGKR